MKYENPQISDYGDLQDLTAALLLRQNPDAEAPGEQGNLDDNTGPCQAGVPPNLCS